MKRKKCLLFYLVFASSLCLLLSVSCALPGLSVQKENSAISPDFADLIAKVAPSVVAITTESVTYDSYHNPHTDQSAGSGWIINENGTIVTNNHVVEGAKSITVEFSDHKAFKASNVTTDPISDIATLQVDRGQKLQPLPVADTSKLRIGDWVLVMGNPLGLGISSKQGIISRMDVSMSSSPEQNYTDLIETSAAINPGNSGGPMINMDGEVIGITSLKIDASGIEGMGYAIAIDHILPIIQILAKGDKYPRPWLGASLTTVDNGLAVQYNLQAESGALIVNLFPGSPAEKAKMALGDIIVGFDNEPVSSADELNHLVNSSKVGQKVTLTFWHRQDQQTVEVTLVETPRGASPILTP